MEGTGDKREGEGKVEKGEESRRGGGERGKREGEESGCIQHHWDPKFVEVVAVCNVQRSSLHAATANLSC